MSVCLSTLSFSCLSASPRLSSLSLEEEEEEKKKEKRKKREKKKRKKEMKRNSAFLFMNLLYVAIRKVLSATANIIDICSVPV